MSRRMPPGIATTRLEAWIAAEMDSLRRARSSVSMLTEISREAHSHSVQTL
jgi:hypothetical protein